VVATNWHLDVTDEVVGKRNSLLGALLSDAVETQSVRKPCARRGGGEDLAETGAVGCVGCRSQSVLPETNLGERISASLRPE
jgi:hypothetical protein